MVAANLSKVLTIVGLQSSVQFAGRIDKYEYLPLRTDSTEGSCPTALVGNHIVLRGIWLSLADWKGEEGLRSQQSNHANR